MAHPLRRAFFNGGGSSKLEVAITLSFIVIIIMPTQTMWGISNARLIRKLRKELVDSGVITPHPGSGETKKG